MTLYKEIQPADLYRVRMPYPFSNYDRQLLTLLYQPMVGSAAVSLYLTLWAEGEARGEDSTHYTLMNTLGTPIKAIFESRIQLEAIGLLKTYRNDGENRSFIYELCPPLDPKTFFADPLLSMFLFSKIGETAYRRVRDRFLVQTPIASNYKEVSRTFTDIFQPVHAKNGYPADEKELESRTSGDYQMDDDFDFALLRQGLSEQLVPKRVLTASIRKWIGKLAFLYGFGPLEMQKVILLAIEDDYKLDAEALRRAASDYYKMTVTTTAPKLEQIKQVEPSVDKQDSQQQPATKEDELVAYLESASPIQVLRDIAGGKEPLPADVQLANQLVTQHGMEPAVVNVLLQYVLLRTDMKLTKAYVEKIASHWLRKNVTTAKQAMDFARIEHGQYMKWKNEAGSAPKKSASSARKPIREEKLPEWFLKKDEVEEPVQGIPSEKLEQEKQKLLAKLALKKRKGD
ncbi:replication initiation and membrane attachment family protein [Planococcus dechangensis]|uniref:Replication initiation and membrane attachment family protein n=1 Tax=Planococcus dechangensis TaxID=1176255 RepID=A0ABV9MF82_9BACL